MRAMKAVPTRRLVTTGDQNTVAKTIDDFFDDTMKHLIRRHGAERKYFEIKSGELTDGPEHITDDRATYLVYRTRMVVATVLETRNEFNHVIYPFFRDLRGFKDMMRDTKRYSN